MKRYKNEIDANVYMTETYSDATLLFKEKRELMERISEINRALRALQQRNPDALAAAHTNVPLRNLPGKKRQDCAV